MEEMVGRALRARTERSALAESCTGGLVGHRITDVPGSSAYFRGGVVVVRERGQDEGSLGVRRRDARARTARSARRPRREMAAGARQALGADVAVSTTGIAGPDGGTPEKPVGHRLLRPRAAPDGTVRAPLSALGHARLGEAARLADRARHGRGAPRSGLRLWDHVSSSERTPEPRCAASSPGRSPEADCATDRRAVQRRPLRRHRAPGRSRSATRLTACT